MNASKSEQGVSLFLSAICIIVFATTILFNIHKLFLQTILLLVLAIETSFYLYRGKFFAPRFFFIFVMISYMLIGGANFVYIVTYIDYKNEAYAMAFYSLFNFGYYFFRKRKNENYKTTPLNINYFSKAVCLLLVIAGVISLLINWYLMGGVPIFYGEEFRKTSDFKLQFVFFIGAIGTIFLYLVGIRFYFWLYLALAIFTAYRSAVIIPSLILVISIFVTKENSERFKDKFRLLFLALIGFLTINLVKFYRDLDFYGGLDGMITMLSNRGMPESLILMPFYPIYFTVVEGPLRFQQIRDSIDGYGFGKYYLESFLTFLPGNNRDYGLIYNNIVGIPNNDTLTATILSPLYLDGGIFMILGGAFFFGLILKVLYNRARSGDVADIIIFSNFLTWLILWIHSGYILTFLFFTIIIICLFLKLKLVSSV